MDMNRARKMIGKMSGLEMPKSGKIKECTVWALIESVKETLSEKTGGNFIKWKATILHAVQDKQGRAPGDDGYCGNFKGDEISGGLNYGMYFAKNYSPFLAAGRGLTHEQAAVYDADMVAKSLSEIVVDEDKYDGVGEFDGKVVVEIKGVASVPKEDPKEPGKLRTYINERFVRRVRLTELTQVLDERDIVRYFGSLENFAELMEAEEAYFAAKDGE